MLYFWKLLRLTYIMIESVNYHQGGQKLLSACVGGRNLTKSAKFEPLLTRYLAFSFLWSLVDKSNY